MRAGCSQQIRLRQGVCVLIALMAGGQLRAQITTRTDAVGALLNEWHAAGTAAGLAAITYENRDGGHSPLDTKAWPQLQVRPPVSGDIGLATLVRPAPVIGNCSMASPPEKGGSLPRRYLSDQGSFSFLAGQYADSNLFIYPEHGDHDPGWNGRDGWGDLFPANVPMVTICQGSSYKDQAFLSAFLSAAAALPRETQTFILRKQWLAPTLQMLLRRSYKTCQTDEDYFSGKAHPVVFDGGLLDEEKMARLAHDMTPDRIPPVVRLEVSSETALRPGADFFEEETIRDGRLGTTPYAVARVFRGSGFRNEMQLSAKRSLDLQGRSLKFRWVLLQGDPARVQITPSDDGVTAELTVAWHPEGRAASGIQTHRVDVGVFAHNGSVWSPPAIVSFYMLPNEARFYDDKGRIEEISYDAGNPDPGLPPAGDLRWLELGRRMGTDQKHPGIGLLAHHLTESVVAQLCSLASSLEEELDEWRKLSADTTRKRDADTLRDALQEKVRHALAQPMAGSRSTLAQVVEKGINSVAAVPDLYLAGQDVIPMLVETSGKPEAVTAFIAARQRLVDYGIFTEKAGIFALAKPADPLTTGVKYHLAQFHLTVLHLALLPEFLERVEGPAYVDSRLTTPKAWRDVHHYSDTGQHTGWTRHMDAQASEFDVQGRLLPQGTGGTPIPVKYLRDEQTDRLVFLAE